MKKLLLSIIVISITTISFSQTEKSASYFKTNDANLEKGVNTYPDDPTTDIAWSGGTSTVLDIEAAFNNARTEENSQLGISLPMMSFPSQSTWDNMTDNEKMFWLINQERTARGVLPLKNYESNVTGVAGYYAQYLVDNDAWGHEQDGNTPWERLESNQEINDCHDFLGVAENLAVFVSSANNFQSIIARSVYNWMYDDGDCCTWGHRHAIVWDEYNNNSGSNSSEGFVGVGHAYGTNYTGPFSQSWDYVEMVVMNVFDPCSSWVTTNISTTNNSKILSVFPNPANKNIKINSAYTIENIQIFDFTGKNVLSTINTNIDITDLEKGIYIVKVKTNKNIISQKLIID